MTGPAQVFVVGSANLDIVVPVEHHPRTGETVLGGDHVLAPGGKGANQAVGAARWGADVAFAGAVGDDAAGTRLRSSIRDAGVSDDHLLTFDAGPSGIALITVDAKGDNAITVSPGANARFSPTDLTSASNDIAGAAVLLLQLEIPIETVAAAAAIAKGLVILDPAPAPSRPLPAALLSNVDIIVPNETELATLADTDVALTNLDAVIAAARTIPIDTVVVTLGARGAMLVTGESAELIPAPHVDPVDTTAAGDAFRAALGVEIASGQSLPDAVRAAVRVGAATTLRLGAQPSLPTRAEVDELLS